MEKKFIITSDDTTDLPMSYFVEHNVGAISLHCMMDDEVYTLENPMDPKEFFDNVRKGKLPTTSQFNPDEAKEFFLGYVEKGYEILHLAFSSGLSGSYQSAVLGAKEVLEEHPDAKIIIIDTLHASLGEGLLLDYAVTLRDEGKSIDEIAAWIEENKGTITGLFVVDDLFHLYRGGRVSRMAAIFGSMASIKPVMHVDIEGKLSLVTKARGRKKSIQMIADLMGEYMGSYKGKPQKVFISHGDCREEVSYLEELIKEKYDLDCYVNYIGTTIGAHTGCGVIALFFMGETR